MRVSNFLLWQIAYAEIYVTETLWPDFAAPSCIAPFWNFKSANAATAAWRPKIHLPTLSNLYFEARHDDSIRAVISAFCVATS